MTTHHSSAMKDLTNIHEDLLWALRVGLISYEKILSLAAMFAQEKHNSMTNKTLPVEDWNDISYRWFPLLNYNLYRFQYLNILDSEEISSRPFRGSWGRRWRKTTCWTSSRLTTWRIWRVRARLNSTLPSSMLCPTNRHSLSSPRSPTRHTTTPCAWTRPCPRSIRRPWLSPKTLDPQCGSWVVSVRWSR